MKVQLPRRDFVDQRNQAVEERVAISSKLLKDRTEAEVRDWYARAEAGTLSSPMTPEEKAELLELLDLIEGNGGIDVTKSDKEKTKKT